MTDRNFFLIVGVVVLAIFGGVIWYGRKHQTTNPQTPIVAANISQGQLVRDDSNKLGRTAKVMVVEFGDYQCPACGAAYPGLKQLTDQYQNKIQFVFRNFPLPMHANADLGALAAEAAGVQGKYWAMHDLLYEKQTEWADDADPTSRFVGYAGSLGLNTDQFKQDLSNQRLRDKIAEDMGDGNALNVNATPTIYINGQQFTQAPTFENLKGAVDPLLAQ